MMRKFAYLGAAVVCLGCSKQSDESAKSAAAPAAPAVPAAEVQQSEDEMDTPGAPPPAAAAPKGLDEDKEPAGGMPSKPEKAKKKDGLRARRDLSTLPQAEAALNEASSQLTKLLGGAKAQPLATGDKRCDQACLAFASLKRAADAICRLAGDTDSRCTRAKRIVDDNETKVKACSCEE